MLAVEYLFLEVNSLQVGRKVADLLASEQPRFRHKFFIIYKSANTAFWLRVGYSCLIDHILDVLALDALTFTHACKALSNPQRRQFSFLFGEEGVGPLGEEAMDTVEAEDLLAGEANNRLLRPYDLLADVTRLHLININNFDKLTSKMMEKVGII